MQHFYKGLTRNKSKKILQRSLPMGREKSFALFIKFFGSLGLKNPIFATLALAFVSKAQKD